METKQIHILMQEKLKKLKERVNSSVEFNDNSKKYTVVLLEIFMYDVLNDLYNVENDRLTQELAQKN